jgi:hypothetical protein
MNGEEKMFSILWTIIGVTVMVSSMFMNKCAINKNGHNEKVRLKAIENGCLYLRAGDSSYHILCGVKLKELK